MTKRNKFLTLWEIADLLRVNKITVYRMAKKGTIPALKVGRQWRFDKNLIQRWLHNQRDQSQIKKEEG